MSWGDFFAMKGYALYIWGSYGVALFVVLLEIALVRHRRKLALQELRLTVLANDQEQA